MTTGADLAPKAYAQIRDALAALSYAADGHYEDEAQVALDALDWLEANTLPNVRVEAESR
jgi:hypothetical protein